MGTTLLGVILAACNDQSVALPTKPADAAKSAAPAATTAPAAGKPADAAKPADAKPADAAKPPEATKPAAPAAAPASTPLPAAVTTKAGLQDVPRKDTLIMSVSDTLNQMTDVTLQNPFVQGALRTGWHFAFEPLFLYNPFWTPQITAPPGLQGKNGEIPYLAESYQYNADFTEVAIKLRQGIAWSDGQPFSTKDVLFTFNMLRENAPKLTWSFDIKLWVKDIIATDAQNFKIVLSNPNPQFMFDYIIWRADIGFPILPEHIFRGQDPLTFTNFDLDKGWPITTGPWRLVHSSPEQKIWDRRDDWWGAKTGFHALPKMKRVVVLARMDDAKKTQVLQSGEVDSTHNLSPANAEVLLRNDKLQFWTTDKKPPYGSLDWWTNGLSFNCAKEPYNDPEIRWAISHAIDRKQIIEVGFKGAGEATLLPFPNYPAMQPYIDNVQDLLRKYAVDSFDPAKTAQILTNKGYKKDGEGFWTKDGKRFEIILHLPAGFFQNFAPVVVAQLRKAGFDASFKSPANAGTLISTGEADVYLNGHGGGIRDPYGTLNLYHSRYNAPTGEAAPRSYRWKNVEFDKLVEEMGRTSPSQPKFMELYRQAMDIWLKELPTIPTVQWFLICPFNTANWKGWPSEKNPYTTPTLWHRGAATLVINTLEPA